MGKNNSEAGNKLIRFGGSVLYYAVIICLLASIVWMNSSWNKKRQEYAALVREASAQDQAVVIEPRKNRDPQGEAAEDAGNADEDKIQELQEQPEDK